MNNIDFSSDIKKRCLTEQDHVLIFSGTTEGRIVEEYFNSLKCRVFVSVATEYGKECFQSDDSRTVISSGRMDAEEIENYIRDKKITLVIDATHPFAKEVTANINQACEKTGTEHIRCLREPGEEEEENEVIRVDSVKAAAEFLRNTQGNILIATGSKELKEYTVIEGYETRCFARVLSTRESVDTAAELGFSGRRLIAMQGPFSMEMNLATLRQTGAKWFVTKESGQTGGYQEKAAAAKQAGAVLVVIGRPKENGMYLKEIEKYFI